MTQPPLQMAKKVQPKEATARPLPGHLRARELAVLDFNARVLAQARRVGVPLLERLRYITIVSSNMDEFFEVRFPDYLQRLSEQSTVQAQRDFEALAQAAHGLIDEQYRVLNEEVMPALARQGVHVINHAQRNAAQRRWVAQYFAQQVQPLLVPQALDAARPFPLVANKSLNFILQLDTPKKSQPASLSAVVIVKVPRALPRVIKLPSAVMPKGQQGFVLLTSVIRAHLGQLLPGRTVQSFSQFRVTRDSDLELDVRADEGDVSQLRQALRTGLRTRPFGRAIRLEVVRSCPPPLAQLLLRQLQLPKVALYRVDGPVNLVRLNQLIEQTQADALRFANFQPGWTLSCPVGGDLFARLQQGPVLLHHPFESFEPVVEFLRQAVQDPEVLAIKQTIYRTGSQSVLMDLLIEAVRRGKDVLVVLELQARFDEEANINWAERLEAAGAQVVYGQPGLKTHAKMLLVTRREAVQDKLPGKGNKGSTLRRYAHLSTGNYNPRTARQYTDLGLLSAHPTLTADIDALFLSLASQAPPPPLQQLVAAPAHLHGLLLAHLRQVQQAARNGHSARVVLKANALTDPALIQALLRAARAGAQIDLLVRGACMLVPGKQGLGQRIRVRSVVGRFLEHPRICYFRWGASEAEQALYLSSADWMSRNMFNRVEVAWPVRDAALRQRVIDECLVPYLLDGQDAWVMQADGRYRAVEGTGPGAQAALMHKLGLCH